MGKNQAEPVKLGFEPNCTIEKLAELKKKVMDILNKNPFVIIDLSKIENADLAFIQFLYAAKREAKERGGDLHFCGKVPASIQENFLIGGFCSAVSDNGEEFERYLYDFT